MHRNLLAIFFLAGAASAQNGVMGAIVGSFGFARGPAVTGAPYSAQEVTEIVQTLTDGTRITQPSQQTTYYRDSQGRTRTEHTFPMPAGAGAQRSAVPMFIFIVDPVAGTSYNLDPHTRTARPNAVRLPPPPPPPPGQRAVSPGIMLYSDPAGAPGQRPDVTHEALGIQMIEGVSAQGERTTTVYPVGFFGNDRPVTTVDEIWTSTELRTVVLSKTSDPRSGDSTTRLIDISRAEPDPALFQVPPDYAIQTNR